MSARQEMDQKIELWIREKLKTSPVLIQNYMATTRKKTAGTRKWYLGYLLEYMKYMTDNSIDVTKVRPLDVQMYINYLEDEKHNGHSIINTKLSAIIDFHKFLYKNGFSTSVPCDTEMKFKKEQKTDVVYMTEQEIEAVKWKMLNPPENYQYKYAYRNYAIFVLGCSTGLRVNEIVCIDVDDVDFDNNIIHNIDAKGHKKREVFFGENTAKALRRWMRDRREIMGENPTEKALFISNHKKRIDKATINVMIDTYTKDICEKHITPHKMRTTCAMKIYEKSHDIYLTAQVLGHNSIETTKIYARSTENRMREAANMLD